MRAAATVVLVTIGLTACGGDAAPVGTEPTPANPVWCPPDAQDRFDARTLVGLSEADADGEATSHGCALRVVVRDGEGLQVTQDFSPSRINVAVRDGVVIGVRDLG